MKWQAVLFDLDDTLYSRADAFQRTAHRLVEVHVAPATEQPVSSVVAKFVEWDSEEPPGATSHEQRVSLFEQIKATYPTIKQSVPELIAWYRDELIAQLVPDPSASQILKQLTDSGTPFGIITNGDKFQLRKIASLELEIEPERIILSDVEGWRKPNARLFNLAIERMGLGRNDNLLMVGDNPIADIQGANEAGLDAAWLKHGRNWIYPDHEPDIHLDSLADLLEQFQ